MSVNVILIVPPQQPDERPDDLVKVDYVARRFGCSKRSVELGLCGTGSIRRAASSPLRFRRADVDEALLKLSRPPQPVSKRRMSLVRRKPRQERASRIA
jgi:hypothetical protein